MVKIVIKRSNNKIRLYDTKRRVVIRGASKRGLPGEPGQDGADGVGVPTGGLPGETLIKTSAEDFDTEWSSASGDDKYYVQAFNISSVVTVTHNLAKFPAITVHDSAGDEVEGTIIHNDINTSTVAFSAPFSGIVTCN